MKNWFSWFDSESADIDINEQITLNLSGNFFNMYTNETDSGKIEGASILINDIPHEVEGSLVKTDQNGNASLSFAKSGIYSISAEKKDEKTGRRILTRPYCIIRVNEPAQGIEERYKAALDESIEYIFTNKQQPSLFDEWSMLTMARGEYPLSREYVDSYLQNVESQTAELKNATDYARVILSFTSLAKDIENVGDVNFLQKMSDYDYVKKQGINGPVFTLIALNSYGYQIPTVQGVSIQNSKEMMIDYILEKEVAGGGWTLYGSKADPDISAMAIQALAPYYRAGDKEVVASVDRALAVLGNLQEADGDYKSWGTSNPESAAQVLVALCEIGKDPLHENNGFVKDGKTLLDGILKYYVEGGGFKHSLKDTKANSMATDQCTYALVAYDRFVNGKSGLYDMSDVQFTIDKTELNEQIKIADSKDMKKYTLSSWSAMKSIYDEAIIISSSQVSKQGEIERVSKKLKESLEALEEKTIERPGMEDGKVTIPADEDKNYEVVVDGNSSVEIAIPAYTQSVISIKLDKGGEISEIKASKGKHKLEIPEGTTVEKEPGNLEIFGTRTDSEKSVIQNDLKELLEKTDEKIKSVKIEEVFSFGASEKIQFSNYVEIVFADMAGKNAAYIDNSGMHMIEKVADDSAGVSKTEYAFDRGTDLVIKTKHFTDFVAFTLDKQSTEPGGNNEDTTRKTVTISVDKKTINKGYVINPVTVEIENGDSVWDVTKREIEKRGISMTYENNSSYGSVYVKSIDGDGEFDHGQNSGWMYCVDGVYPSYGSSSFKLNGGENVQWRYTKNLGEDLGQDNSSWGGSGVDVTGTVGDDSSLTVNPQAKVTKGEAIAEIDKAQVESMLKQSQEKNLTHLVIEPETKSSEAVESMSVILEKASAEKIAASEKAVLRIKTQLGDIVLANDVLRELAGQKANTVTLTVKKNKKEGTDFEIRLGLNVLTDLTAGFTAVLPLDNETTDSTVAVQIMPDSSKKMLMKSAADGKQIKAVLFGSATVASMQNEKSFTDTDGHWGASAIEFASARGILRGTAENQFSPDSEMNRAMLVTLLHRFDDERQSDGENYADVNPAAYYSHAAQWAKQNSIVSADEKNFNPGTKVTRQMLAEMIYSYAIYSGEAASSESAVDYCVSRGILVGKSEGSLNLEDTTTRAEVSAIIQRYVAQTLK